jgi:uncharacterized coiled-coil protein SlyX
MNPRDQIITQHMELTISLGKIVLSISKQMDRMEKKMDTLLKKVDRLQVAAGTSEVWEK